MADYYVEYKNEAAFVADMKQQGFDTTNFEANHSDYFEMRVTTGGVEKHYHFFAQWIGVWTGNPNEYVMIRALTPETDEYLQQPRFKKRVSAAPPVIFL